MLHSTRTPIVKAAVVTMVASGAMFAAGGTALAAAPGQTGVMVAEGEQGKSKDKCKKSYKSKGYKSYGYGSNYGYGNYGYRGYGYGYGSFGFGLSLSFGGFGYGYGH